MVKSGNISFDLKRKKKNKSKNEIYIFVINGVNQRTFFYFLFLMKKNIINKDYCTL